MSLDLKLFYAMGKEKLWPSFVTESGLTEKDFSKQGMKVYFYYRQHCTKFKKPPSPKTIQRECNIDISAPDETAEYYLERLIELKKWDILEQCVDNITEARNSRDLDGAQLEVINTSRKCLDLGGRKSLFEFKETTKDIITKHEERKMRPGIGGIPLGFSYLTEVSDGAHPGDLIVLSGLYGAGKTYALMKMLHGANLDGHTVLAATTEMAKEQFVRRLAALFSNVGHDALRKGTLPTHAVTKMREVLKKGKHLDKVHWNRDAQIYIMDGALTTYVEDVILRISELKPDVVYVDGAYLLNVSGKTDGRYDRITSGAEMLKTAALNYHIPIIATYQWQKSSDSIYMSKAVAQLATIILHIRSEEKTETFKDVRNKILTFKKGREGEAGGIKVAFDMRTTSIKQTEVLEENLDQKKGGYK